MTVYDIDIFMSGWAKKEYSESWDNDGIMLCGDISQKVTKIQVCLELNKKTLADAIKNGCELVITHHPFIFRPLKSVEGEYFETIKLLMKSGISVLSYHTRLDAARGGVNDALAEKLGLSELCDFGGEHGNIGRVGTLPSPMTESEFAAYIREKLSCGTMRCSLSGRSISRVALVGGGGKDYLSDAAECADAFVTADLSHNSFIDAKQLGLSLFDAGHYFTENPVCEKIKQRILEEFPCAEVAISDSGCPFSLI